MTQPPGYGPPPGYPAAPGYPYPYPYQPVPMSPAGLPLADYGSRLLAYLIDVVLIAVVLAVVTIPAFVFVLRQIVSHADRTNPDPFTTVLPIFAFEFGILLFALIIQYLYAVEWMHRSGQTLGKRIMRIRVIPLDPRVPLTRLTAFKRYAAQFLPAVFFGFYALIDDLWPLWDKPFQQALHDKAAQTVVVKVSA